jgi:hypothetical protein
MSAGSKWLVSILARKLQHRGVPARPAKPSGSSISGHNRGGPWGRPNSAGAFDSVGSVRLVSQARWPSESRSRQTPAR